MQLATHALVGVVLALMLLPSRSEAQLPPAEMKKISRKMQKIHKNKNLSDEEKATEAKAIMAAAMEKLEKKALKKKAAPRFSCGNKGKYKVMGTVSLPEPMPGRFVWLEIKAYKGVDTSQREFRGNVQCGVGFTTQSNQIKVTYKVENPGFFLFGVHVDRDENGEQGDGDLYGISGGTVEAPIVDFEAGTPMEIKKKRTKNVNFAVAPASDGERAVDEPAPHESEPLAPSGDVAPDGESASKTKPEGEAAAPAGE